MPKVLHVLYQSHPNISGSSTRTNLLLKWLQRLSIDNIAITTPFQEPFNKKHSTSAEIFPENGVKVYRTYISEGLGVGGGSTIKNKVRKIFTLPYFTYRIYKTAKIENPDIIHAHATFICALPAIVTGKLLKIPVAYEIRSLWFENSNFSTNNSTRKISAFFESICIKLSDHVIAISRGLSEYAERYRRQGNSISIIRNGVDDDEIENVVKDSSLPPQIRFAYIGSVIDLEGLDYVLTCLNNLKLRGKHAEFHIYGDGPKRAELEQRAKAERLPVIFHGRFHPKDTSRIYEKVDVIVNYRKSNNVSEKVTPLKPLEALLHKKTLICSDVGGYREILDHNHAIFIKPDDPKALESAILKLMEDPNDCPDHEAGLEFVRTERLWSANAKKYSIIYDNLLENCK